MARRGQKGGAGAWLLVLVAIAAPLVVLGAAFAVRFGAIDYALGHDQIVLRIVPALAAAGLLAGLILLVQALRRRASLVLAVIALLIPAATLCGWVWQTQRTASGPGDVSTDLAEIPGFGDLRSASAGGPASAVVGIEDCPGAQPAMTQVAPETAVWALQESGFSLQRGPSVSRAAGTHRGFWFGTVHDAVIRIRPGRTDIRVASRDGRPHGGEACRLVTTISEALRSGG